MKNGFDESHKKIFERIVVDQLSKESMHELKRKDFNIIKERVRNMEGENRKVIMGSFYG